MIRVLLYIANMTFHIHQSDLVHLNGFKHPIYTQYYYKGQNSVNSSHSKMTLVFLDQLTEPLETSFMGSPLHGVVTANIDCTFPFGVNEKPNEIDLFGITDNF